MTETEEKHAAACAFYKEALQLLQQNEVPFLLGGAFAFFHYTGIYRDTKDMDLFCRPGEYPHLLKLFADNGYVTELTDARWLAKIFKGEFFIDIIFNTPNGICTVTGHWYEHAVTGAFEGIPIRLMPPEELVWCKIYVQNRERFDGADVNHLLLRYGQQLNWKRLLAYFDQHWHLLLAQLLVFQFVYPADYGEVIPGWLFDELLQRAQEQYTIPASKEKVCLGPLIDQTQYQVDIVTWNYKVTTMKTI